MHVLHFSKRNPEASMRSFREHLQQVLSFLDDAPSQDDFKDHIQLIKMFIERDEILSKSQILLAFAKNPEKAFCEDLKSDLGEKPFIVDDDVEEVTGIDDGDESEEDSGLFDSVCAICDNGGELLCCEGRCLRSFHATKEAGEDSDCASLGLTMSQVEAMQSFFCKNCQLKQHQCFACGKLGSSDKSANPEVFSCVSATCGHFYHPKCVAGLLFPDNKTEAAELEKKIVAGESFTCPVHRCFICKQVENKEVEELQFAMCRRCPKAYHRKCLPRKISFEDVEEEDVIQRAWEGLLPNRILIYCLKHDIDEDLGTPSRDHITFPGVPERIKEAIVQKTKPKDLRRNYLVSDGMPYNYARPPKKSEKVSVPKDTLSKGSATISQKVMDSQYKLKAIKKEAKSDLMRDESKEVLQSGLRKLNKGISNGDRALKDVPTQGKLLNTIPKIAPDIVKEVHALVQKESSSLTHNEIRKMLSRPSTHQCSTGQIDKGITLGKIEGAIEAVRTAFQKLESGANVEDAKAVCEPEILKQLIKWNTKLKVYLAPVLHGARYSSYGRHFTKSDKLEEISDKLQWYVRDGDTIVDFCCGANEFSLLMKEKLDSIGKKCSFRNYDILQAKNDFNFEKRDWMTVQPRELPPGAKLIMGLNPPFGINARLANQFIDKALTFNPKILILIVPEETKRLDSKSPQYDLIWEDRESLSGKSFYLPGSIDVYDKQIEQWNLKPPVLYLWSRPDWTAKHNGIASSQGHTSKVRPTLLDYDLPHDKRDVIPSDEISEEKPKIREATPGERETVPVKHKSLPNNLASMANRDIHVETEVKAVKGEDIPLVEKQKKIEGKNSAPELIVVRGEADNIKQLIHASSKKREFSVGENESRREVNKKKLRVEERSENAFSSDDKGTRDSDHWHKSLEIYEDKPQNNHNIRNQPRPQQQEQQQQQESSALVEKDELIDMSLSPSDIREPIEYSFGQAPIFETLGSPVDWGVNHAGYSSGPEMRAFSIGRPSPIDDDIDDISRKYGTSNTDSFHMKPAIPVHDYSRRSSEEGFGGYNGVDTCTQNNSVPDNKFRMQVRTYGMHDEEDHRKRANEYGLSSEEGIRMHVRTYGMQGDEVHSQGAAGYGRTEEDMRKQVRAYGMQSGEDHRPRNMFSLGSGQESGFSSLHQSSNFRLSGNAAETPTLQRYAPRLDEMNYPRPPHVSPGIPFAGRDDQFDRHSMRHDMPPSPYSFMPGTYSSFPNQGSGGWIDD
ncbi:hypothetical protein AXF42_Ash003355 [Apostasia shenzhenica]|uniref:Zinc finger PHD-type domain-containing protein n=1 Tax=Apostasia shenzhenica TaxID=1088818 RepID=A0A2I0BFW7_9ASPA|nr:hypothetical protein AXF42_Ash003355 [Apostasia shenzhenica]